MCPMKTVRESAAKVLPIFAIAYVATLPWTWAIRSESSGRLGTLWIGSVTVVLVALGLIVGSRSFDWRGSTLRSTVLSPWVWAVAMLMWALVSVLWSPAPQYSLGRFLQLTSLIAATWAVSQLRGRALRTLLEVLAVSTAGVAALLIAQAENNIRPRLGSMDPNTASIALLIGYVAAIALWGTASRLVTRIVGLAASVILISGLMAASASRSALLGLLALYVTLTLLVMVKKIRIYVFGVALVTVLISTAGTLFFVGALSGSAENGLEVNSSMLQRSIDITDPTVVSLNGRTQIWGQYFGHASEWGAKGYGIGIQAASVPGAKFGNLDTHSVPLQVGVQLGVVGLMLWIMMALLFLRMALQSTSGATAILMWIAVAPLALTTATADLAILWVSFALASACPRREVVQSFRELDQSLPHTH